MSSKNLCLSALSCNRNTKRLVKIWAIWVLFWMELVWKPSKFRVADHLSHLCIYNVISKYCFNVNHNKIYLQPHQSTKPVQPVDINSAQPIFSSLKNTAYTGPTLRRRIVFATSLSYHHPSRASPWDYRPEWWWTSINVRKNWKLIIFGRNHGTVLFSVLNDQEVKNEQMFWPTAS